MFSEKQPELINVVFHDHKLKEEVIKNQTFPEQFIGDFFCLLSAVSVDMALSKLAYAFVEVLPKFTMLFFMLNNVPHAFGGIFSPSFY
jgi:hypothetical protein